MTYPPSRYGGTGGEVSARHRPSGTFPDLTYANGTKVHHLATGAGTDGLFGLYRWEMGPESGGAAPHFHRTIHESFYVLDGTILVHDGERWFPTTSGDFVHVPPGGIHGFRNESGAPAAMLIHFAPGAPREGYFAGIPRLGEMSDDERSDFFLHHDNHWLG